MPVLETVFFYFFALGALLSSGAVVAFRNPLYSAIALILDFFFFAGLYILLSAHFMAVVQVLVYGGAIMVLFVFIIMLLNLREQELGQWKFRVNDALAVLVGFGILGFSMIGTSRLIDRNAISERRAEVAQQQKQREADAAEAAAEGEEAEKIPQAPIMTTSAVPGLFTDLNEPALEAQYQRQLAGLRSGDFDPSARKYPTFEKNKKFDVPPALAGKDHRGAPLEEPVRWGTAEPISILLVNRFVVPFELTAMLLLAAIVGAVIIAKKRL